MSRTYRKNAHGKVILFSESSLSPYTCRCFYCKGKSRNKDKEHLKRFKEELKEL